MLSARQDVSHLLLLLLLPPDSPSLPPPAAPPRTTVPPPPAAVPPPGADRSLRARRCAPAGAAGGARTGPGGAEPRGGRGEPGPGAGAGPGACELPALQPEPGARAPAADRRGPGVAAPLRVPGRGGAGSVRRARVPAEPRGAATGGPHRLLPGDPLHQRPPARRAAPHAGKSCACASPHLDPGQVFRNRPEPPGPSPRFDLDLCDVWRCVGGELRLRVCVRLLICSHGFTLKLQQLKNRDENVEEENREQGGEHGGTERE